MGSCAAMSHEAEKVQVLSDVSLTNLGEAAAGKNGQHNVTSAQSRQEYEIGNCVQVRDRDTQVWQVGRVTSVAPLKVMVDGHTRSYAFNQVARRQCVRVNPIAVVDISAVTSLATCEDCITCCDAKANACFVPCGHVVVCVQCVPWIEPKRCPVCRQNFADFSEVVQRT
jgi:hypothetical protein